MRPVERLAVDVFFQQAFAHHQAKIFARPPPWRISGFIDDMAQIIQPPRHRRFARCQPLLARLPALPLFGGKAQNLNLDAAAFQRPRQNIGASRRNRNRPAAHRAGIVQQQRHNCIAEIGVLFAFEAQGLLRIHNHAAETRRVQNSLFKVKFPGAVLLRHQPPLQAVCQPRHHRGEVRQLLVEIGAQPVQLFRLAQVFRRNNLVVLGGKRLVIGVALMRRLAAGRLPVFGGFVGLARLCLFRKFARRRIVRLHGAVFKFVRAFFRLLKLRGFAALIFGGFALVLGLVVVALVVLVGVFRVLALQRCLVTHIKIVQ